MDVAPAEEELASDLVEGGELGGARLVALVEEEQRALARTLRLHAAALLEHLGRNGVATKSLLKKKQRKLKRAERASKKVRKCRAIPPAQFCAIL